MKEIKKSSIWLIPFFRDEVKVWDTIIIPSRENWVDEYWDIIKTNYHKYYVMKKSTKRNHIMVISDRNILFRDTWLVLETMDFDRYIEEYWIWNIFIDRRPRYKKILASLLWLNK